MLQKNCHITQQHILYQSVALLTAFAFILLNGCGSGKETKDVEEESTFYHADNDIAMTFRSIADALHVGEEIKSEDYNFRGILTDGQGRPLYTDIHGNPGEWVIDVNNPESVTIQNIEYGDLLPEDLEEYIISALSIYKPKLNDEDEYSDDIETSMHLYEADNFKINFITRSEVPQNGIESVLLNIVISSKP